MAHVAVPPDADGPALCSRHAVAELSVTLIGRALVITLAEAPEPATIPEPVPRAIGSEEVKLTDAPLRFPDPEEN